MNDKLKLAAAAVAGYILGKKTSTAFEGDEEDLVLLKKSLHNMSKALQRLEIVSNKPAPGHPGKTMGDIFNVK